jgi:hypothetical protein
MKLGQAQKKILAVKELIIAHIIIQLDLFIIQMNFIYYWRKGAFIIEWNSSPN